jgi:hypothetical protein
MSGAAAAAAAPAKSTPNRCAECDAPATKSLAHLVFCDKCHEKFREFFAPVAPTVLTSPDSKASGAAAAGTAKSDAKLADHDLTADSVVLRHIRQDGSWSEVPEPKDGTFELDDLQAFVGGYIDIVVLNKRLRMVVNDEGLYTKGYNKAASELYKRQTGREKVLHGDVLLCHVSYIA